MKSTSKTNDGSGIIPFHAFLPQPDEEARDERKTPTETRGGRERERDGDVRRQPKLFQFHRQFPV